MFYYQSVSAPGEIIFSILIKATNLFPVSRAEGTYPPVDPAEADSAQESSSAEGFGFPGCCCCWATGGVFTLSLTLHKRDFVLSVCGNKKSQGLW